MRLEELRPPLSQMKHKDQLALLRHIREDRKVSKAVVKEKRKTKKAVTKTIEQKVSMMTKEEKLELLKELQGEG